MTTPTPLARYLASLKSLADGKDPASHPTAAMWAAWTELRERVARLERDLSAERRRNTELHRLLEDEWHDGWCAGRDHALNGWEAAG